MVSLATLVLLAPLPFPSARRAYDDAETEQDRGAGSAEASPEQSLVISRAFFLLVVAKRNGRAAVLLLPPSGPAAAQWAGRRMIDLPCFRAVGRWAVRSPRRRPFAVLALANPCD